MSGNAVLVLEPGEHWFRRGKLVVKDNARLEGSDVVLFFGNLSRFEFEDHAMISLEGRKTGAYAGMVMVAGRGNQEDFRLSSDRISSLLGVVYVPNALLIIDGGRSDIAKDSDWTVIVARSIQLRGAPSLVINANYAGSDVPVPSGVGPRGGSPRLVE
jgi:hypothetical protein